MNMEKVYLEFEIHGDMSLKKIQGHKSGWRQRRLLAW